MILNDVVNTLVDTLEEAKKETFDNRLGDVEA